MAIKNINTDLQIEAGLRDGDGDLGTNNQILISTGTGINWVDGSGSGIIGGPYLPLVGGTLTGNLTISGGSDIFLADNGKTHYGASNDLEIYHNGTHSYIDEKGTGDLIIRSTLLRLQSNGGESMINASSNGTVQLYYDNSEKLKTATTGITITGELEATTLDINGNADISGIISGNFVVRSTNNSNADGANFSVDTTNKNSSEYAYEVLRSGTTVAGITTVGKITGTELEGTSLDINGNGDVSGNLTINGGVIANGGITGLDTAGGISGNNYNISGVNQLSINDPGEGIVFSGTTNVQLFTIDDATDSILKITSATALDVNAKITNLSPGSANLDAVNYQQLEDAVAGVLVYQGTWNASTNTPALASGVGTPGYYYIVSTPGSTNLDGITDWNTGDWAIFSDQATDAWQKIDHTNVLNGAGTGNQVTKWSGAGTSYTLTDSSITDNGTSVGIGTTTPNAVNKLEVTGQLRVVGNTMIGNSGTTNTALMPIHIKASGEPGIRIEDSDLNNLAFDITVNEGDGFKITETTGGDPGTDVRLFIEETTGNVGIGTTSPSEKLEVSGNVKLADNNKLLLGTGSDLEVYHDGSNSYINQTGTGKIIIQSTSGINVQSGTGETRFTYSGVNSEIKIDDSAQVNKVVLKSAGDSYFNGGNVGIGTTSPTRPLSVHKSTGGSVANFLHYTDATNYAGLYIDVDQATDMVKLTSSGNAAGGFSFNTATNERLTISTAGNIGIGDPTPNYKLDVNSGTTNAALRLKSTDDTVTLRFEDNDSSYEIRESAEGLKFVNSSGNTDVTFLQSGNVGIGTTSPQHILDVTDSGISTTAPTIRLTNSGNYNASAWGGNISHRIEFYSSDPSQNRVASTIENIAGFDKSGVLTGNLVFKTKDYPSPGTLTEKMRIAEDGNVGIGTITPTEKLQVTGNISASGDIRSERDLEVGYNNANYDQQLILNNGLNKNYIFTSNSASISNAQLTIQGGNYTHAVNFKDSYSNQDNYATLSGGYVGDSKLILFNSSSQLTTTLSTGDSFFAGDVGIGTNNPSQKLQVVSDSIIIADFTTTSTKGGIKIAEADEGGFLSTEANRICLGSAIGISADNLTYHMGTNKLGIGTTNPTSKLTISSDIAGDGSWDDSGILISNTATGATGESALVFKNAGPNGTGTNYWFTGLNQSAEYKLAYGTSFSNANSRLTLGISGALTLNTYGTGARTGTAAYNLSVDSSGNVIESTIGGATPATPGSITSTIVGETIEIEFDESTTSNIDYYQVWSSDDGGDFGIIAQITPTDFSSTMTVVDTTFVTGGTMSYRVYAVKSGVYSSPGTTSIVYTVGTLDVTDMTVINLNTAYYIQYEKPASRFIDHIEIYMDSQTTQGALNRSNASIVYSGQNPSYMRSVGVSNNFHQFWVEVVTT